MDVETTMGLLIDAINAALVVGDWALVVQLTDQLDTVAIAAGEMDLGALVRDLHCIAADALVRPLDVMAVFFQ